MQRHGYSLATTYTYGAYPETFANHLTLLSLMAGHRPPAAQGRTVIEFGCGQGLNLCLQAALHPEGCFVGIDLSADHVAHATELAATAGLANIHFLQADLLALAAGAPLPSPLAAVWGRCHIALAHGLLAWVSPEVRQALRTCATAALAPGGLLYLSYNSFPGWLAEHPFQHTVLAFEQRNGGGGQGVDQARMLFERLQQQEARIFRGLPDLSPRVERLGSKSRSYLVHEYTHQQWQPLYADQVIEACAEEGLVFLGSADLPEFFPGLLPEAHQQLIQEQPDAAMKQLVRDLLVNQAFRRDVYAHGRLPLWAGEAEQRLGEIHLGRPPGAPALGQADDLVFQLGHAEVRVPETISRPLLQRLEQGPATIADLQALSQPALELRELMPVLCLLLNGSKLQIVQPAADPTPARRLNALLLERMASGAPYRWLACPATGGVLRLERMALLGLHALQQDRRGRAATQVLAATMARHGLQLEPDGSGNLEDWLERFAQDDLPTLQALGLGETC